MGSNEPIEPTITRALHRLLQQDANDLALAYLAMSAFTELNIGNALFS